jgi:hypothetical protein
MSVVKGLLVLEGRATSLVVREKSEAMSCRLPFTLAQTQNIERRISSHKDELALPMRE